MSVLVIAEAGVNHNGDPALALKLVEAAAAAGADAVKFQTFRADQVAVAAAPKAAYQAANTGAAESQLAMLRRLELSADSHLLLRDRARALGIEFLSTAFDSDSLAFLVERVGIGRIKIPSGEVTNGPLLAAMAATDLPMILSTGMCELAEIAEALDLIAWVRVHRGPPPARAAMAGMARSPEGRAALDSHLTLLHCTTEYPAPPDEINLRAMATLAASFALPVGLSDHSEGVTVAVAAVALGARVIEKHFTLDRALPGPDHRASLEPDELARMVAEIRLVERALGSPDKAPTVSELGNRQMARRSLVAARPLRAGDRFGSETLTAKRPGSGLSPLLAWDLAGKTARRDYLADEAIDAEELT